MADRGRPSRYSSPHEKRGSRVCEFCHRKKFEKEMCATKYHGRNICGVCWRKQRNGKCDIEAMTVDEMVKEVKNADETI